MLKLASNKILNNNLTTSNCNNCNNFNNEHDYVLIYMLNHDYDH